jgi:putative component of membrane protein insertase Oxa1/YidC/SpoIIIJ protein YidD
MFVLTVVKLIRVVLYLRFIDLTLRSVRQFKSTCTKYKTENTVRTGTLYTVH